MPLISLVIPTRERASTLWATLGSALSSSFQDYECIVSDNCSNDNTEDVVRGAADARVRYFRTDRRLSMCDNWEFALSKVQGRFVIFVGDDDAVTRDGVELLARKISELPTERAFTWQTSTYQWPIDDVPAKVIFESGPGSVQHAVHDLRAAARRVMRLGGWGYYRLPSAYHGAVATDSLRQIAARTGRVFHSTQPDLFTALALPSVEPRYVRLASAVTIQGRSAKSNGGVSVSKDGAKVTEQYVREFGDYRVHASLPPMPRVAGLIVDAFLRAKDMFPDVYADTPFNYEAMWAFLRRLRLIDARQVLRETEAIRERHDFARLKFAMYCLIHDAVAGRRSLLDRLQPTSSQGAPPDIYQYARQQRRLPSIQ